MKVQFKGLGPNDSVTYKGALLRNGAVVEMNDIHAKAYLNLGIAFQVKSDEEAEAFQKLEKKNFETRKRIEKKVESKKEGEQ